jgi:predicted ester cyclase
MLLRNVLRIGKNVRSLMEVYAQFGNGIAMRDRLISKTGGTTMEKPLADIYRDYIACLNEQDWDNLGRFVHQTVSHNDRPFGLAGYRAMLEQDFKAIPDLQFNIELLVSEPPTIAAHLAFDCTPVGALFGLPVNGRNIRFAENVFYTFENGLIKAVWSIIDKAAIEAQL